MTPLMPPGPSHGRLGGYREYATPARLAGFIICSPRPQRWRAIPRGAGQG